MIDFCPVPKYSLFWGIFLMLFADSAHWLIRIVQRVLAWEDLPGLLGDTAGGSSGVGIWWTSTATWLNYMTQKLRRFLFQMQTSAI